MISFGIKFIGLVVTMFFAINVWALTPSNEFAIELGFRQQSGDTDLVTTSGANTNSWSTSSQNGIQGGATALIPFTEKLYLRTGLLYTQRPLIVKDSSTPAIEYKFGINYLDLPLNLMYKFEDYGGLFAGIDLAMQFDSSCSASTTCKVDNIASPIMPIVIGAAFKFAPQFGGTLYFETMSGKVADNLKNYRALGFNLFITFE